MRYLNNESKNILKLAKDTAKAEKRKILTMQQFFLSSLRSPKIESLLTKMDVDIRKLKSLLKKEINEQTKESDLEVNQSNDIDFSVILIKFLNEISGYYDKKLSLVKRNKLDESHALIEPYDLILCLFTLNRSDQQELKPIINIQNLAFECSMRSKDKNYEYQKFVIEINSICSKHMQEKLNIQEKYTNKESSRELPSESNEHLATDETEQKNDIKLCNFAENLNLFYQNKSKKQNIIGRVQEIKNIEKILLRKHKNNPILVGEHGVGKTAVIEQLVANIVNGKVPDSLKDSIVWSLNISKLISGTKYRGDFEKRMNSIISELESNPKNIVFIDNMQQILNTGSGGGQGLDLSGLLQPAIEKGVFKCIGTIGLDEYNKIFTTDKGLARRFQKVTIEETSEELTLDIIKQVSINFEEHHKVLFPVDTLEAIISLSSRYLHKRKFPDKALDLLDEAGALYSSGQKKGVAVQVSDIYEVVSQQANLNLVNDKENLKKLKSLEQSLMKNILGQDRAVSAVTKAVLTAKAGLSNPKKPYGSFLFLGPTGVGKTEITLQLGEELGMKVHRFDMSEYSEEHTISKLIGTPPGYVGHEEGGQLTDAVEESPYSIVLFDEIEKANKKIYNTLLQVLDNGFLTDSKGRKVSFRNTIIILTSNAGASSLEKKNIGFNSDDKKVASVDTAVLNQLFTPEFRNRLSAVITFDFLSEDIVLKIVDKFILELEDQIKERDVKLTLTPSAKKWLMNKGYNRNMGARPMERAINDNIKQVLSYELLFGSLSNGGKVKIGVKNDSLVFTYN